MNQLHPIYHSYSFQPGSRIDVEQTLPADLEDADLEELLDQLSEPPKFTERISPVSTVVNTDIVRGRNWSEMMVRSYRLYLRILTSISYFIRQALVEKFGERTMVPFMSLEVTPEVLHRIVELDYEHGENTYAAMMDLFRSGVLSPVATVPFHGLQPLMDNDFDRRLMIRAGLLFYWDILEDYHEFLRDQHGDPLFMVPFSLPECAFSHDIAQMLQDEVVAFAKAHRLKKVHVLLMLDNVQARDCDLDVLMKSWNQIELAGGVKMSIMFRDRAFSDWVTYSNPSVKKLIDRTIAKVDSELNRLGVEYCWSHFEEIESLTFSSKSAMNFEQKIVKLAQLSYMAVSSDFFVRRKMSGAFGRSAHEPQTVSVRNNSAWSSNHGIPSMGKWVGLLDSNARFPLVDENRPYLRRTRTGKAQENGPQCWKIAYTRARAKCTALLKGDPATMTGGFVEVLAGICGSKDAKITARNVADFLTHYIQAYLREHFIQHDLSEADAHIEGLVKDHLLRDCRKRPKETEIAMAGVAAQGYYFAIETHSSYATHYENLDQRAMYQSVVMLTLAFRNLIALKHWQKRPAEVRALLELLRTELVDFAGAYDRYRLADFGVTRIEWDDAIKSAVEETPMNVVERAARRTAARHLRPLGLRKDFTSEDANLTTNVGHLWTPEVENTNYKWENKLFCGMREE